MFRRHVRARFRLYGRRTRRFIWYRLLHADDPPYKLAMGVAIGTFIAFTPTIPFQMILCVVLAWALRANVMVTLPVVWISNPVTFVPIYYPLYLLGTWILGSKAKGVRWFIDLVREQPEGFLATAEHYWDALLDIAAPLWVGCLVFAVIVTIPTYYMTYYAIWGYRMKKWGSLVPPRSPRAEKLTAAIMSKALRHRRLILGSASPRRSHLMEQAGYRFEVVPSPFDEAEADTTNLLPRTAAAELAARKAWALAERFADAIIIAADTMLVIGDRAIGKPKDEADARQILRELIGRPHEVVTAVAFVDAASEEEHAFVESAAVTIAPIGEELLEAYIASGAWRGKAGGYNLDELRDRWSFTVTGDETTVIGLPMQRLGTELAQFVSQLEPHP